LELVKLAHDPVPEQELYDARRDHREMHDLATHPEHRERMDELRSVLDSWLQETGMDARDGRGRTVFVWASAGAASKDAGGSSGGESRKPRHGASASIGSGNGVKTKFRNLTRCQH